MRAELWLGAAAAVAVAAGCWALGRRRRARLPAAGRLLLVSGCDSGLGFSLALRARRLGFTVLAGVLRPDGAGAQRLSAAGPGLRVLPLDVTDDRSVRGALAAVERCLAHDPALRFHALVNNAGVMVFGEFEWQTERLVRQQLDVNLLGTMRVTRAFLPLLRQHAGRVVTVTSHCSVVALPGVSVYGATKAALAAWSDALRIELHKFGVPVVQVLPGSFFAHSGLMSSQQQHALEMEEGMTEEQRDLYQDYFTRYQEFLRPLGAACVDSRSTPEPVPDEALHAVLEAALLSPRPAAVYERAPLRYRLYHALCRRAPSTGLRDALVSRFVNLPPWKLP